MEAVLHLHDVTQRAVGCCICCLDFLPLLPEPKGERLELHQKKHHVSHVQVAMPDRNTMQHADAAWR